MKTNMDFTAVIVCTKNEYPSDKLFYIPIKFYNDTSTYPINDNWNIQIILNFFSMYNKIHDLKGVDVCSILNNDGKDIWNEIEEYSINKKEK
jgi:hypothetical protein